MFSHISRIGCYGNDIDMSTLNMPGHAKMYFSRFCCGQDLIAFMLLFSLFHLQAGVKIVSFSYKQKKFQSGLFRCKIQNEIKFLLV